MRYHFTYLLPLLLWPSTFFADEPLHVRIDTIVNQSIDGPVSVRCDDATFLRRASLDLIGTIPSSVQSREFLADDNETRREDLIDRLLSSNRYATHMASKFDIMLMERRGEHAEWERFLVDAFAENKAWDVIVREILSPDPENETTRGSAFFYTKRLEKYGQTPNDMPGLVRDVGRMFLGVDVQCAQCHDHLFVDDYKQADWQGLFAFVGNTNIHRDKDFPAIFEKPLTKKIEFASVFDMEQMSVGPRLPGGSELALPVIKKGEEYEVPPDRKTKEPGVPKFRTTALLSQQLPTRDNAAFSRNAVNRIWWMMMGRGLVEPLDMHHSDNPASHPQVLSLLSDAFVAHEFDIRWLIRELALTQVYQRSSILADESANEATYRTAIERPLSAEQLLHSMLQATGVSVSDEERSELVTRFRDAFANPPKEPELTVNPTVKAALFLLNDPEIQEWLEPQDGNLIDRVVKIDDRKMQLDEIYLASLTRFPTDDEREAGLQYLNDDNTNQTSKLRNLTWALLASAEFSVNH